MNADQKNNAFPFDLGLLEVNKKAKRTTGSAKIIETLRHMFIGKMVNTFEFDYEHVLNEDVRKIFSNRTSFVGDSE